MRIRTDINVLVRSAVGILDVKIGSGEALVLTETEPGSDNPGSHFIETVSADCAGGVGGLEEGTVNAATDKNEITRLPKQILALCVIIINVTYSISRPALA